MTPEPSTEELRELVGGNLALDGPSCRPALTWAADRIEHLELSVAQGDEILTEKNDRIERLEAENARLTAENERLDATLRNITVQRDNWRKWAEEARPERDAALSRLARTREVLGAVIPAFDAAVKDVGNNGSENTYLWANANLKAARSLLLELEEHGSS